MSRKKFIHRAVLHSSRRAALPAALTLFAKCAVPAAHAAEVTAPQTDGLQEIVVTARKREENLQQVPVSITAVTTDELKQRSIESLQDLGMSTPNVSFYNMGQANRSAGLIYIRGIGQSDPVVTNDPGVGVYLDGVYFGVMQGLDLDMLDVSRVEVLRGPQGTLFGKNTIGGAINIVSARPSLDAVSGDAQVTVGDYGRIDGTARVNVPILADTLALSVSGASHNAAGFGHSLATGQGMGNTNSQAGRVELLFRPSESLDVIAAADRTRVREQGAVIKLLATQQSPLVGVLNMVSGTPYDNRWLTAGDFTNYSTGSNLSNADISGESLTATWRLPTMTLQSISSYRANDNSRGIDPDGSPLQLIDETGQVRQHQFSQELQLSGISLSDRLNWVAGLYYFSESAAENDTDLVFTALRNPIGLDLSFQTNITADNKSYAAYSQGTYTLTDQLRLTAGLRETHEQKSGTLSRWSPFSADVLIPYTTKSASWNAFSPRLSLEDQITRDVMLYVSAANGFKSGGFNGRASASAGFQAYSPEKVWTFETGLRSSLLDRRLRLNATAYYSLYQDIQFTIIEGSAGGTPVTNVGNAAKARITGGELEIDAVPISRLTLTAALGLTDPKYTRVDANAAPITVNSHFQETPKTTATFSAEYTWPVANAMELLTRADYAYRSTAYLDAENSPIVTQHGYGLLNGRVTLRSPSQTWSVAAFGTNLTNKHYFTGGTDFLPSLGFAEVQMAAPRMWGATVEYRF
ncbi:MAG TPA: TonB-dependent receptor [Steroidobacteraceae bacterium]|nr:TonB-dependent receptor [Steroidobacteraceae bacterium]